MAESELTAPDDLIVAAVAAACAVGLSVGLKYGLGVKASLFVRLIPLYLYFVYLFGDAVGLGSRFADVRGWAALIAVVTAAIASYYAALA